MFWKDLDGRLSLGMKVFHGEVNTSISWRKKNGFLTFFIQIRFVSGSGYETLIKADHLFRCVSLIKTSAKDKTLKCEK